jgi:hypothetical protein
MDYIWQAQRKLEQVQNEAMPIVTGAANPTSSDSLRFSATTLDGEGNHESALLQHPSSKAGVLERKGRHQD